MQLRECFIESVWYDTTQFCFKAAMSAIAIAYTRDGFVVAADGRQISKARPGQEPIEKEISDRNQKIFSASAPGATIAFAITGFVAAGASYDLIAYAKAEANKLSSRQFRNGDELRDTFSHSLKRYIGAQKRDGVIEYRENTLLDAEDRLLIASAFIVGYFQGRAFWLDAHFHHDNQDVSVTKGGPLLVPGQRAAWGSTIIPDLAIEGDHRFARYRDRLAANLRTASLEVACEWARAYVELCSMGCGI
jgi:hypothetical protein